MTEQFNNGYKKAVTATGVFGGVQGIVIIFGIIRSKLVAIWLGVSGFGVYGVFNVTINLIFSISNIGLQSSAVRDIAAAQAVGDALKLAQTVKAIKRWVVVTGLFGTILTICLAPLFSNWFFSSDKYVVHFIFLSIIIFFSATLNANHSIIQGCRQVKKLALSTVYGAFAGFCSSIPILYFFREQGIVLALIMSALSTTIVSTYFVKSLNIEAVGQSIFESYHIGLATAKLGIMMALSNISVFLVQFIVKAIITKQGGLEDVGLYEAGWILNAQYLGIIFTAMTKDYYPRLSQVCQDNKKVTAIVNEQAEIALLIMGPMIIALLLFLKPVIELIYSHEFIGIVEMTKWLLIGSLIKAGSWAISYVFLAKGNGKIFLFNELGINVITIPITILCYYVHGLEGIGYAFIINYLIYFILVSLVAYFHYSFSYGWMFWKELSVAIVLCSLLIIIMSIWPNEKYLYALPILVISMIYTFVELDKRIELVKSIKRMYMR